MTALALNDHVTWTSQARGSVTKKTGRVAFVPDAKSSPPWRIAQERFPGHKVMFDGNQFREGSVLVEVPSTGRAKPRLYMPWPGTLKKVA